jgi:hypothetical protein
MRWVVLVQCLYIEGFTFFCMVSEDKARTHGSKFKKILFFNSFIHMCIHCLGHFSTLLQSPPFPPNPSQFQAGPVLPLSLILLKKRHKHSNKDKAFLLVKDSYTERFLTLLSCIHVLRPMLIHLYTGS